jgi:hypothetical protein
MHALGADWNRMDRRGWSARRLASSAARTGERLYEASTDYDSLDKNDIGPRHSRRFRPEGRVVDRLQLFQRTHILQYRPDRGDARHVADRSASLRSGREGVLPFRRCSGLRRRHRLSQGTGEIVCISSSFPASRKNGRGSRLRGCRGRGVPVHSSPRSSGRPSKQPP